MLTTMQVTCATVQIHAKLHKIFDKNRIISYFLSLYCCTVFYYLKALHEDKRSEYIIY